MASAACRHPLEEHSGVAAGEEAGRELDALCESVMLDAAAIRKIALFAADHGLTTAGATAFGCLLHLVRDEAASFWWEFAAGAGELEAAYLLMLDHKRRAELHDEELWRDRLTAALNPQPERNTGPSWRDSPSLPEQMRRGLHQAIRYAERHEHEDLGDIPVPTSRLARALWALTSPVDSETETPDFGAQDQPGQNTVDSGTDATATAAVPHPVDAPPPAHLPVPAGRTETSRLWMPPPARPGEALGRADHAPAEWEDSLRVLDVLQLIRETGSADIPAVARTAGITPEGAASLLSWLAANSLSRPLDEHTHGCGPLLTEIARGNSVLQSVLDQVRDDTGAAIYLSTYTDGEIAIPHSAWGPKAPQVTVTVDFKETPHASAVGKSLLSQLNPADRADLLSRHRPKPLTRRTITNTGQLIDAIDQYGPQSPYFDVLEYSDAEVCVAISLPLAGQACSVALSLPVTEHHRLLDAAQALSDRSTGLLLALVLATNPTSSTMPTPGPPSEPE
ncbi:IclR family transcriptional regulator domain-containing protein, partial [Streptomyces sp. NPDC054975]